MGYWAGKENRRFYIEDGIVLSGPKGTPIAVDPVTLEFVDSLPPATSVVPVVEEVKEVLPKNVLEDFMDDKKIDDFVKEGRNTKPITHAKDCKSGGRGGRYTDGCPKCEFLKKSK